MIESEEKPVLKMEGEIGIKNSTKLDEQKLHPKKFVKWIAEGSTSSFKIDGNPKVVQHFTSVLA